MELPDSLLVRLAVLAMRAFYPRPYPEYEAMAGLNGACELLDAVIRPIRHDSVHDAVTAAVRVVDEPTDNLTDWLTAMADQLRTELS